MIDFDGDENDLSTLRLGQTQVVNNRLYVRCPDCRRVIRIDGWLGELHLCIKESA